MRTFRQSLALRMALGMLALFASHPPLEVRIERLVSGAWRR